MSGAAHHQVVVEKFGRLGAVGADAADVSGQVNHEIAVVTRDL
jgi:hypothetical protein